jgi:hypothetical protein
VIVRANSLQRLECLFPEASEELIFAAQLALDAMDEDIEKRGATIFDDFKPPMSGIRLGEAQKAEGASAADIGAIWLVPETRLIRPLPISPWWRRKEHLANREQIRYA